jgi:hypothetical protein
MVRVKKVSGSEDDEPGGDRCILVNFGRISYD